MSSAALSYLANQCRTWGGRIQVVAKADWQDIFYDGCDADGYHDSPSADGHGISWPRRIVYVTQEHMNVGTIIHEMGHVFLDPGDRVWDSEEYSWIGWEIRMARLAGCYRTWSIQNNAYNIGGHPRNGVDPHDTATEWKDLSRYWRLKLEKERVAYGQQIGIIDAAGSPLARR